MRENLLLEEVDGDDDQMVATVTAYIKAINLEEAHALGAEIPTGVKLRPGDKLFALNAEDGTTIAVSDSRTAAYVAALQNNFLVVSVH